MIDLSEPPRCPMGNSLKYHDRPCGPGCNYPPAITKETR